MNSTHTMSHNNIHESIVHLRSALAALEALEKKADEGLSAPDRAHVEPKAQQIQARMIELAKKHASGVTMPQVAKALDISVGLAHYHARQLVKQERLLLVVKKVNNRVAPVAVHPDHIAM
jgi:hypothetical protein